MESLEQSIEAYELQLKQVKDAILASAGNSLQNGDLVSLQTDLEQLISLTKQNLVELKKEQLLKELEGYDDSSTEIKSAEKHNDEGASSGLSLDPKEGGSSPNIDASSLEGVKCQAPFKSVNAATEFYHNAVIFAVDSDCLTDENVSYENLKVQVVFSNPTCQKMIPCKYYIDGKCNFAEDRCRHSHGEVVSLAKLKEFRDPEYENLTEGSGVLALYESSELWKHATVEGVEHDKETGSTVHVRFSHDNKKIITLPLEHVVPLNDSSNCDSGSSDEDGDDTQGIVKAAIEPENDPHSVRNLLDKIDGSVAAIGGWESHTKGIGSKLMASMGYIHGTGLGKLSEGRREPVPIMIYPSGCSIDYCMNLKEKYGNSDSGHSSIFSAEKVLEKARKKEEIKNLRKLKREKNQAKREQSFFDLLNSKLVSKESMAGNKATTSGKHISLKKTSVNSTSSKQKADKKSQEQALKLEGMKTFDEIKRKEKEIERLEQSLKRYKNSGDREILSRKLQKERSYLSNLKSREKSINQEQSRQGSRKKLEIF